VKRPLTLSGTAGVIMDNLNLPVGSMVIPVRQIVPKVFCAKLRQWCCQINGLKIIPISGGEKITAFIELRE
jgi:hypothetical protein